MAFKLVEILNGSEVHSTNTKLEYFTPSRTPTLPETYNLSLNSSLIRMNVNSFRFKQTHQFFIPSVHKQTRIPTQVHLITYRPISKIKQSQKILNLHSIWGSRGSREWKIAITLSCPERMKKRVTFSKSKSLCFFSPLIHFFPFFSISFFFSLFHLGTYQPLDLRFHLSLSVLSNYSKTKTKYTKTKTVANSVLFLQYRSSVLALYE